MLQYFFGSYLVTVLGVIAAYFWAEHTNSGSGWTSIFIVAILAILEVSLSFDNAVVNAMKLEKMTNLWRQRFLTWGIAIAVFGMRFLFPILVVSIFANLSMGEVARIAINDSEQYAHYLHLTHAPIVTFGGIFLLMLFLHYFFNSEKTVHWIKWIEEWVSHLDNIRGIEVIIALIALIITQNFISALCLKYTIFYVAITVNKKCKKTLLF